MGLLSGILGGVVSLASNVLGKKSEKKQAEAQNQANQQAVQASVETTDRWRQEDLVWQRENTWSERDFTRDLLSQQHQFDRQQIAEQNAYNDPSKIRERAEAAGFNPLALLGTGVGMQAGAASSGPVPYGGGAGGVSTTIAPVADIAARPVASSDLSLIGEAFGSGMQEYSSAVSEATALRQHNDALKQELAKAVIRPSVGGIYGGGDVPVQMIAANKYGSTSNPSKPPAVDKDAEAASEKGYATGSKSGTLFGMQLETSGLFSDGAWFTDKYGEPAEWAVAVPSLASDVGYTIGKNARRGVDSWIKSKKDAYSAIDWEKYSQEADQLYKRKPRTEFDHYKDMRLKYSR